MPIIWFVMSSADPIPARFASGKLTLHEPERQRDAAVLPDADRTSRENRAVVLFAAVGEVAARRAIPDHFLPIQCTEDLLDLGSAQPGRVQTANHGPHAGTGDRVDRYVHRFECADHPDVGAASCAPAPQDQPDARTCGLGSINRGEGAGDIGDVREGH